MRVLLPLPSTHPGTRWSCSLDAPQIPDCPSHPVCAAVQAPLFISSVVSWLPGLAYDAMEQHYRLGPRCGHAASNVHPDSW